MARCSICDHPERHLIEQALHAGDAQQTVADRFGLGSRKPLRTHLQHFTVLPQSGAPPAPSDPPGPALPTVAQCTQQLQRLQSRLGTCQAELASVQAPFEAAQSAYRLAVWREQAGTRREANAQLERLEKQRQELSALAVVLAEGIAEAQSALDAARARRQAAEVAHWTTVLEQLEDPFEQYCCQLLRFPNRWPPPTTPAAFVQRLGPMGLSAVRKTTLAQLRARYPFVEEGAIHAVSGVL